MDREHELARLSDKLLQTERQRDELAAAIAQLPEWRGTGEVDGEYCQWCRKHQKAYWPNDAMGHKDDCLLVRYGLPTTRGDRHGDWTLDSSEET